MIYKRMKEDSDLAEALKDADVMTHLLLVAMICGRLY